MPGSEHHYGMQNGAVIRDWYCDICQVLAFEKVTCLDVPQYPLIICPKCSKAKGIGESLMDTIGMEYPSGIYTFRDHLMYHLRTLHKPYNIEGFSLNDRQLNYYQLKRAFKKAGADLKEVEKQYLN